MIGSVCNPERFKKTAKNVAQSIQVLKGISRVDTLRNHYIKSQLKVCESDYTELDDMNFYFATWNVAGLAPQCSLQPLVAADLIDDEMSSFKGAEPDIMVFAFQELDLGKDQYVFTESAREVQWKIQLKRALERREHNRGITGDENQWYLVQYKRLIGMMLLVFAVRRHKPFIGEVCSVQVPTGIMGVLGNKGAVAIRFKFHQTTICIVNSHLAAGDLMVERRNADYETLSKRISFSDQFGFETCIGQHDAIVWLGDLNYRISELVRHEIIEELKSKNFEYLMKHDQLLKERNAKKVFQHFKEAPITFPPSYKYDLGTNEFDTSEKKRKPAWCDRILYKGQNISIIRYTSLQSLTLSDHKPVMGLFKIGIRKVDVERRRIIYNKIIVETDKLENECKPEVKTDEKEFDFGEVTVFDRVKKSLKVTNTGSVITVCTLTQFEKKIGCPPWLSIYPKKLTIFPGTADFFGIELSIDRTNVSQISGGSYPLENTLILHVEEGGDCFIPVRGKFLKTSFGMKIESSISNWLSASRADVGVAHIYRAIRMRKSYRSSFQLFLLQCYARKYIPFELLWMLWDLYARCIVSVDENNAAKLRVEEDLFQRLGLREECIAIREALDTRKVLYEDSLVKVQPEDLSSSENIDLNDIKIPFPPLPGSVFSVAESLTNYFQCLPKPIIHSALISNLPESDTPHVDQYHVILCTLDPIRKHILEAVIYLIKELTNFTECYVASPPIEFYDKNYLQVKHGKNLLKDLIIPSDEFEICAMKALSSARRVVAMKSHDRNISEFINFLLCLENISSFFSNRESSLEKSRKW